MESRMKIKEVEPRVYEAMEAAEKIIRGFGMDQKFIELIKTRVSQINGCGYCINMHTKKARELGETEQRLYALSAWWETPFFSEEEQLALELAEEITMISSYGVSDSVYESAVEAFGEQKLAQLILLIITINGWNRIAISTHMLPE